MRLMPTYEYLCEKCGQQFDIVQPISAKALTVCPKESCTQKTWGKGKVKRLISAGAGVIFKGSGFYITDYRSDDYKSAQKNETKTDAPAVPAAANGDGKGEAAAAPGAAAAAPAAEAKPAAPAEKPAASKSANKSKSHGKSK